MSKLKSSVFLISIMLLMLLTPILIHSDDTEYCWYDPEAGEYLELKLLTNDNIVRELYAEMIEEYLGDINIKVETTVLEWNTLIEVIYISLYGFWDQIPWEPYGWLDVDYDGQNALELYPFDLLIVGISAGSPFDPLGYINIFGEYSLNFFAYNNSEFQENISDLSIAIEEEIVKRDASEIDPEIVFENDTLDTIGNEIRHLLAKSQKFFDVERPALQLYSECSYTDETGAIQYRYPFGELVYGTALWMFFNHLSLQTDNLLVRQAVYNALDLNYMLDEIKPYLSTYVDYNWGTTSSYLMYGSPFLDKKFVENPSWGVNYHTNKAIELLLEAGYILMPYL